MSYLLGYITADGCVGICKGRKKNPYTFNITSIDKGHLYRLRKIIESTHKISQKNGVNSGAFQLQLRNSSICIDLIRLGIIPRKTARLQPMRVPKKYFADFVRGYFDGDGTVYMYRVNNVWQIKAGFVSASQAFFRAFHTELCKRLGIPEKTVHTKKKRKASDKKQYTSHFYIDDCKKLADFMYGNHTNLYLPRKRRVFEKWNLVKRRSFIKKITPQR